MPVAQKISQFIERSSWIRAMFEAGAKLKQERGAENVFDFSLGNPNLSPPEAFYEVLGRLASDHTTGFHGYMPNSGYPEVRAQVAAHLEGIHGVPFTEGDIVMTVGAAGALNSVLKAIVDPGADVVVPTPYFVEYDFYLDNHGGKVTRVPTTETFGLDVEAIRAAIGEKTCAVLINTPNNPTGAVYGREELTRLAEALEQESEKRGRPIYLIADEPYREIVFDGLEVPPLMSLYRDSIVVTSFSKNLSLAGERIGYLAVHPEIADKKPLLGGITLANRILGYVNAPAIMQRVVAELLEETADIEVYAKNRDLFCAVLDDAGFSYIKPMGAFYLFPKCPIPDDVAFAKAAQEEGILLVPGSGFMGPGYVRLAFCTSPDTIERSAPAFKRLRERF